MRQDLGRKRWQALPGEQGAGGRREPGNWETDVSAALTGE